MRFTAFSHCNSEKRSGVANVSYLVKLFGIHLLLYIMSE